MRKLANFTKEKTIKNDAGDNKHHCPIRPLPGLLLQLNKSQSVRWRILPEAADCYDIVADFACQTPTDRAKSGWPTLATASRRRDNVVTPEGSRGSN